MKKGYILSAILGGACFAVPYLAFEFTMPISLVLGVMGYGAGSLFFNNNTKTSVEIQEENMEEILSMAEKKNSEIIKMLSKVEDDKLKADIREIYQTADKIIKTVKKDHKKIRNIENFFTYYLPQTYDLLKKYDEIENQRLGKASEQFMAKARAMVSKINATFKKQLAHLYQEDIIDTDAEMKVFDSMIKSDGYGESDFKL